jgi:hypothetical protein
MGKKKQIGARSKRGLSFDQWITYVFDHAVPHSGNKNPWYHTVEQEWWDPLHVPKVTVAYLTRLFTDANSLLLPFSEAQINQGLWFLADNSCSNHMLTLLDPLISSLERKRCIFAMFTLFERFFAPRCSPHLSHLDVVGTDTSHVSPLNGICYMWWDVLPQIDDEACLEVMGRTLDLDAMACHESALHGLGHWAHAYPQEVETIISAWLARNPYLKDALKEYAHAAREGRVQ